MKLTHLTDKTLLEDTSKLVQQEREFLSKILWHLKEIQTRKLYSDMKCASLFEYCVKILRYSEGQAARRISAMRLLIELPELSQKIEDGDLNLTHLNQARQFFLDEGIQDKKTKKDLVEKIVGKPTREAEKILWQLRSEDSPKKINLILKEETVEALKKTRDLKAHTYGDFDSLILKMCQDKMREWDPTIVGRHHKMKNEHSRFMTKSLVAEIWTRDQKKCTNCGSTHALEIDHLKPFALGGKTTESNLRLLCRSCNQRKSKLSFARTF